MLPTVEKEMNTVASMPDTPFSEASPSWTGNVIIPIILSTSHDDYKIKENELMAEKKPARVGFFSLTGPVDKRMREFHNQDYAALRRLQPYHRLPKTLPHGGLDLNREDGLAGVKLCKMSERGQNDGLIPVLQWILANRDCFRREINEHEVKVVGERTLVRKVGLGLQHPARHERGWLMAACKFKEVVYIKHFDTDDDLQGQNEYADRDQQRSWSKMFLNLVTSEQQSPPRDLNINDAFNVVMRYDFGSSLSFLYYSKINGYDDFYGPRENVPGNAYDCNLNRAARRPNKARFAKEMRERRYGDWWQITHFTGERGVIIGYNTEKGCVTSCEAVEVAKLVEDGSFSTAAIVGCVSQFLHALCKDIVLRECSEAQYLLRYEPEWSGVVKVAEVKPDSEYRVLPQWFIDGMSSEQEVDAVPVALTTKNDQVDAIADELAAFKCSSTTKEPSV